MPSSPLLSKISHFLFPPKCLCCGELLARGERALCGECGGKFHEERETICPTCEKKQMFCTCRLCDLPQIHLAPYHAPVTRALVLAAKREEIADLTAFFADALAERIKLEQYVNRNAALTYVPRAPEAVREHGVDQARVLAEALAARLRFPLSRALRRPPQKRSPLRSAIEQKSLTPAQRAAAAKEHYRLTDDRRELNKIRGKYVYLVDDVLTTGATVGACAALLRQAGAAMVIAVAAAKS